MSDWSKLACCVAAVASIVGVSAGCTGADRSTGVRMQAVAAMTRESARDNPNSAADAEKGIIQGWLDGKTVPLRYTRLYFCAEPPTSAVSTKCEVGAQPTIAPRSGSIPKIYALAPIGFHPDPSTVHCPGGTVCLNHPPSIDLSRIHGPDSVFAPAHSHIITARRSGWHETVNIRVTSLDVWNEIAAAKSLTKVRELQAAGRLGPDNPTNIYFFFEVQDPQKPHSER